MAEEQKSSPEKLATPSLSILRFLSVKWAQWSCISALDAGKECEGHQAVSGLRDAQGKGPFTVNCSSDRHLTEGWSM
jgi:hypothetical protein